MNRYSALIVDDDVWMQRILVKVLEGFGCQTYVCSNGFDAIAMAVRYKPTVVLLDIMMPELSGHLTLKVMKRIDMLKDVPIVMISALSDTENLGNAVKEGAVGFVSKPFTRATIHEKLRQVLGSELLEAVSEQGETSVQTPVRPQDLTSEAAIPMDDLIGSTPEEPPEHIPEYDPEEQEEQKKSELSSRYQQESSKKQIDAIKNLLFSADDE